MIATKMCLVSVLYNWVIIVGVRKLVIKVNAVKSRLFAFPFWHMSHADSHWRVRITRSTKYSVSNLITRESFLSIMQLTSHLEIRFASCDVSALDKQKKNHEFIFLHFESVLICTMHLIKITV